MKNTVIKVNIHKKKHAKKENSYGIEINERKSPSIFHRESTSNPIFFNFQIFLCFVNYNNKIHFDEMKYYGDTRDGDSTWRTNIFEFDVWRRFRTSSSTKNINWNSACILSTLQASVQMLRETCRTSHVELQDCSRENKWRHKNILRMLKDEEKRQYSSNQNYKHLLDVNSDLLLHPFEETTSWEVWTISVL